MELAKEDNLAILQAQSGSGQQLAAIHAPLPSGWTGAIAPSEGSGGQMVPELIIETTGSSITLKVVKQDPLAALLNRIEAAFGLTRDELASISRTTRKTIYNWLDGTSAPHKKNQRRLFELDVLATDWANYSYPADRVRLKQPAVDGRSVFELLCEDPLDQELVLFAGARVALQRASNVLADSFAK